MRSILSWLYLILAFGFIYLPVVVLVLYSFQESGLPVPPFDGPSLKWYDDVLGDSDVTDALTHSLLVAVGSSVVAVILGFLAAYGLARYTFSGSPFIRLLLIAPLTVSYLIVGLGLLIVLTRVGLGLSLVTAGIGHVVINLPLAFAIIFASMNAKQENAERAARDLGATEMSVIFFVSAATNAFCARRDLLRSRLSHSSLALRVSASASAFASALDRMAPSRVAPRSVLALLEFSLLRDLLTGSLLG